MKIDRLGALLLGVAMLAAPESMAAPVAERSPQPLSRPFAATMEAPNAASPPGYDSGATHWASPMLENTPGTIGGAPFSIDRKRLNKWFELSIVNPNADHPANVNVSCHDAAGAALSRYAATITVAALGASNWSSAEVTPPPTIDGASQDIDVIWCVTGGDVPIVVYGWTIQRFGSEVTRNHFSLERVTPR